MQTTTWNCHLHFVPVLGMFWGFWCALWSLPSLPQLFFLLCYIHLLIPQTTSAILTEWVWIDPRGETHFSCKRAVNDHATNTNVTIDGESFPILCLPSPRGVNELMRCLSKIQGWPFFLRTSHADSTWRKPPILGCQRGAY